MFRSVSNVDSFLCHGMKQESGKKRATKIHVGCQNNEKRQEVGDDLGVPVLKLQIE